MAIQGKTIEPDVRAFVLEKKEHLPRLTNRKIADLVVNEYGESARIDRSTVGRIVRGAGLTKSAGTNTAETVTSERRRWVSQHWVQLSLAVEAYKQNCSMRVQGALTRADRGRVVTMPAHGRAYGDDEKRLISVIRSWDEVFENLEDSFSAALASDEIGLANNLGQEIQGQLDGWLGVN
jgi:uncharacterized circularly permuted ATP-grasp superfamily protein